MAKIPSTTTINPSTGQYYTADEVVDYQQNAIRQRYANMPFGSEASVTATQTRAYVPQQDNDYLDYSSAGYQIGLNNQEERAQLQPWYEQISNSFQKGAVIAGTTFADGTAGILAGLYNAAAGPESQGVLDRFINNPFSNYMLDLQKKAEAALPNYFTKEELESPLDPFSANFWGENIIKNMGFAVGALSAGYVSSGMGARLLGLGRLNKTSKVLEGIAATLQDGKQLSAAEVNAVKALSGERLAALSPSLIDDEISAIGKAIQNRSNINQLGSSFIGSVGEARIEALNNSREFKERRLADLQDAKSMGLITEEEYYKKANKVDQDLDDYRNALFAGNVALLSLSNFAQFRNVFARGYTPTKLASNTVANLTEKGLYEIAEKNAFEKTYDVLKYLKNPLTEMGEEQGQFALQRGADDYFTLKNDDESKATVMQAVQSIGTGLQKSVTSDEGWLNGLSGFIIGAIGVPGFKATSKLKIGLNGGIYEDVQQQKAANERFATNVERVNNLVQQGKLKTLVDFNVVNESLNKLRSNAVDDNDRVSAKTINSIQLANMVDAYVELGKYDDFVDSVEEESNLSVGAIRDKYKTKVIGADGQEHEVDFFQGMTNDQVREYIKNKSENTLKQAERIKRLKQDIDLRFGGHAEDARKELLFKAAAAEDMSGRIMSLAAKIKAHLQLNPTGKDLDKLTNTLGVAEFFGLTKPADFEEFLTRPGGLEEYEKIVKRYLNEEGNTPEAIKFAEDARDLYTLVRKRQEFNDLYFKMADPEYASNTQAASNSSVMEKELSLRARSLKNKQSYDENTKADPKEGFYSNVFRIDNGEVTRNFVEGTQDGKPISFEYERVVAERTAENGDVYKDYAVIGPDGQEQLIKNVKAPKESSTTERDTVDLEFRENDPNNLWDQEGNSYAVEELENDPSFIKSEVYTIQDQRNDIINGLRKATLQRFATKTEELIEAVSNQITAIEEQIKSTQDLLQRALNNKSGTTSTKNADGKRIVFKIVELEKILDYYESLLENMRANKEALIEEQQEFLLKLQEAKANKFSVEGLDEDINTVQRQIDNATSAIDNAEKKIAKLKRSIASLKNLVKALYSKFKEAFTRIIGQDPSNFDEAFVEYQSANNPILNRLSLYDNIKVKTEELEASLKELADLEKYVEDSKALLEKLQTEKEFFNKELDKLFSARRLTQAIKKVRAKAKASTNQGIDTELDGTHENAVAEFSNRSARRSVVDSVFVTRGKDVLPNGDPNPNPSQRRWSAALSKINLSKGKFSLRVVTAQQRRALFELAGTPENMMDTAIGVILYKDGRPVDANLTPLADNAEPEDLVFQFIPLPGDLTNFSNAFYDADLNQDLTKQQWEQLNALREELFKRASEDKPTYLPVTEKSLGILDSTGARRDAEQDLTTSVWTTLLGNEDDKSKMEVLKSSKIVVAQAQTPEEAAAGRATISVNGTPVSVINGLAYFVTPEGGVIPLISRKLSFEEVELVYSLLDAVSRGVNHLVGSEEDLKKLEEAEATPDFKVGDKLVNDTGLKFTITDIDETTGNVKYEQEDGKKGEWEAAQFDTFIRNEFLKPEASKKKKTKKAKKAKKVEVRIPINAAEADRIKKYNSNPKTPSYRKIKVYKDKSTNKWYKVIKKSTGTKEAAAKLKAAPNVSKFNLLTAISNLIYFGPQTKGEDSLLISNPNPQTEIFIDWKAKTLKFFDFEKMQEVTIPFTSESLAANKDALTLFLANKYHQVSNDALKSDKPVKIIKEVVTDETGIPMYVRTEQHSSYADYLISDKNRDVADIPLTTNARPGRNGKPTFYSTYLKFSGALKDIKDSPVATKATTRTTPKAAPGASKLDKIRDVLAKVNNFLSDEVNYTQTAFIAQVSDLVEPLFGEEAYYEELGLRDQAFEGDEISAKLKEANEEAYTAYVSALLTRDMLNDLIAKESAKAAEETTEDEDAENPYGSVEEEEEEEKGNPEDESSEESGDIPAPDSSIFDAYSAEDFEDEDNNEPFRTQVTGDARINIEKAINWLETHLPNIKIETRKRLINGIGQGKLDINGILYLSELAEEGSEYHEALHAVMLGILTDEELKEVYAEAKRLYGKPSSEELAELKKLYPKLNETQLTTRFYDEKLAEDFRTYALSGGKIAPSPKVKGFFQTIWESIKAFLGIKNKTTGVTTSVVDEMFKKLYNGEYVNSTYSTDKVKERINSTNIFSPLNIPGQNAVVNAIFTNEAVNSVLANVFQRLHANNNTTEDLIENFKKEIIYKKKGKIIKESAFSMLLNDAIDDTKKQLDGMPDNAIRNYFKDAFLNTDAGKKEMRRVLMEYIHNDIGIDLGIYQDVNDQEESEVEVNSRDNKVEKDATTFNPREGANSHVKLMLSSLKDYTRNKDGTLSLKTGDMMDLPMLINPIPAFNNLLKLLHTSSSFSQMIEVIRANKEFIPYLEELESLLTNPHSAEKDMFGTALMRLNFQRAMNKAAIEFRFSLINEDNTSVVNPTQDSLDTRIAEQWRNGIADGLNTPNGIVSRTKETSIPVVNAKRVSEIRLALDKEVKEGKKPYKKESFFYYADLLNAIGFTITAPDEYTGEERDTLVANAKPLISELTKANVELDYVFNKSLKGRIKALSLLEAKRNFDVDDFQHIGPDGKTRYGMSQHHMISMISQYINNMPKGVSIRYLFAKFPALDSIYSRNSYLFNHVLFRKNPVTGERERTDAPFKLIVLEGARVNQQGEEGETNTRLDQADRTWISFNSILRGMYPILRTSDKSLEYGIETTPLFSPTTVQSEKSTIIDMFINYLRDELNFGKSTDVDNVKYNENIGDGLYFFEDILRGKVPSIQEDEAVDKYIARNRAAITNAIGDFLNRHVASVAKRLEDEGIVTYSRDGKVTMKTIDINLAEELNVVNTFDEQAYTDILYAFTANSLAMNIEQTKMFFGHPAFYKDLVDIFKRTAGAVGTKDMAIVDSHVNSFLNSIDRAEKDKKVNKDGTFNTLVLSEPLVNSTYYEEIKKSFVKQFGATKGAALAAKYLNVEEADGQGLITLPEYREFMIRTSNWSRTKENLYHRAMRGEDIPFQEVSKVFNSVKAQYFNLHKIGDTSFPVYLKFSLLPLIPSVYRGKNMAKMAESMMANNVGIAVYPSGIKTGALMQGDTNKFYSTYEGTVGGRAVMSAVHENADVLTLDYRFMGIQVDTGDTVHANTTRGSQDAKIKLSNVFEQGTAIPLTVVRDNKPETLTSEETKELITEYHDTIKGITKIKLNKLLKEIGAVKTASGTYKIQDVKALAGILKQAAGNRRATDDLIASFDLKKEGEEIRLKYMLDGVPGRNKIENILMALLNNNVITQKYHGGTRIQAAPTGFEEVGNREVMDIKGGKVILNSNPNLRFYTKGKHGETLPAQVKLTPNKEQMKLIESLGGLQEVNKKLKQLWALEYTDGQVTGGARYNEAKIAEIGLNPEIFQFVAYRIPTQGVNTIEHLEIAEFLDPLAGEAIHLPSELVTKSGGDYDIDKLNVYFKYIKDGNPVKGTDEKGLHNRLIEISQDILSAPEMYNELLLPNSVINLKEMVKKIREKIPAAKLSKTQTLTWGYTLDIGRNYLVGKKAVGIVARHITHHTLAQQANLVVQRSSYDLKGETHSNAVYFKGMEDVFTLASIKDINKDNYINHIISEFLSGFVDIGKDPFIVELNGDTNTADLFMYLLRRGVPLESVVYFMNQPIIREYYEKLAGANAMFKEKELGSPASKVKKELISKLETAFKTITKEKLQNIESKYFSAEELFENIGTEMDLTDLKTVRSQYLVLMNFLEYQRQANGLRTLMDVTADDTTRNKNFNSSDNFLRRVEKVEKEQMFTKESVDAIYNTTFLSGFKEAQEVGPSALRTMFQATEHPIARAALDNLRTYLLNNNESEETIDKILDRAKNDLIVYITSVKHNIRKQQRALFLGEKDGEKVRTITDTVATRLKSWNNAIRNNPFYQKLIPLKNEPKSKVGNNLKLIGGKLSTFEVNQIVNGFRGIKQPKGTHSAINQDKLDLAFTFLLQSGFDYSPISAFDKVPIETASAILKPALMDFIENPYNYELGIFTDQFIRNNYYLRGLAPTVGTYKTDGTGNVKIDSAGVIKLSDYHSRKNGDRLYVKVFAQYEKYNNNKKAAERDRAAGLDTGEFLLFTKVGGNTYKLIDKLGDKMYMKEYGKGIVSSMISDNTITDGKFTSKFTNWSEPNPTPLTPDNNTKSLENMLGEENKKNCKTK